MSQTTVRNGDSVAIKQYSVALFVQTQKTPSAMKNLTGPAPSQSDTEKKLKLQTSPDMPIVRVQDLARTAGDTVSVDCVNITSGKPIMGDRDAEGKGEKLSFSSMDVKIDLATKPIDAGGKMSQQRTRHQLRGLALANAAVGWICSRANSSVRGPASGADSKAWTNARINCCSCCAACRARLPSSSARRSIPTRRAVI